MRSNRNEACYVQLQNFQLAILPTPIIVTRANGEGAWAPQRTYCWPTTIGRPASCSRGSWARTAIARSGRQNFKERPLRVTCDDEPSLTRKGRSWCTHSLGMREPGEQPCDAMEIADAE